MKNQVYSDDPYRRYNRGAVQTSEVWQDNFDDGVHSRFSARNFNININDGLSGEVNNLITTHGCSFSDFCFAVFRVLLLRHSFAGSVFYIEDGQLAPRFAADELQGSITFSELLARKGSVLASSTGVVNGAEQGLSRGFVTLQSGKPHDIRNSELKIECDLFLYVSSHGDEVTFYYDPSLIAEPEIEILVSHYTNLVSAAAAGPQQLVGSLSMLTPEEVDRLVYTFNDTVEENYCEQNIVDLFETQVSAQPQHEAIVAGTDSYTYQQLNERANRLAHFLINAGVTSEDSLALIAGRGAGMVAALYAVLKAGGAYVPIEPSFPPDRQRYMLCQSRVKYLLHDTDIAIDGLPDEIRCIDLRTINYDNCSSANPGLAIHPQQLAYTIYTSGSTGVPKGVMIEHHSAVNLVRWVNTKYEMSPADRGLFVTSMCFDLSVYDIFGMLAAGGTIVVADKSDVQEIDTLAELLQQQRITFWNSVPSTMDLLVSRLSAVNSDYRQDALRVVFMSGDWIPVALPDKIRNFFGNAQVVSLGGATEGTVWSNYYAVNKVGQDWSSIPYGGPITNNSFYILNEQLQPVPQGVVGDLYIGGVGVARGYANDEQKTHLSFLSDPFFSRWGGRMYRTGDLGRMRPDGQMEFIGRKDSQVKIRGYRVEPGEIENVILGSGTVKNAVVLYHKEKKQLIGYLVPGNCYDRDTLLVHLKNKLPDYMVPAKLVELDSIPLTENGKINAKALLQYEVKRESGKEGFLLPRNEMEAEIAAIWRTILNVDTISVNDNFFDSGGQSILAVELITEIEKKTGRPLPLNILYKYPTIARLCAFLNESNVTHTWKSLVPLRPSGSKVPLYVVHGDGLSISNFHNLAESLDDDQPIYSLNPQGLNGTDVPPDSIPEIARQYVDEIIQQNPFGPYALAGYSFGGYVAIEMKKQLELLNKKVKILAIFDTDAANVVYKKQWTKNFSLRLIRQVPKLLFIMKSMFSEPAATFKYQYTYFSKRVINFCEKLGLKSKPAGTGINLNINRINEIHARAFKNFELKPFDDILYLFRARKRVYFVDDFKYLGWTNYAQKGVNLFEVPGDHLTMFQPPNVSELARSLQFALDNS